MRVLVLLLVLPTTACSSRGPSRWEREHLYETREQEWMALHGTRKDALPEATIPEQSDDSDRERRRK
jgi:hypothetical protein